MKKSHAYELFGAKGAQGLAHQLHITRSAVVQWPDPLRERQVREVIGTAVLQGRLRLLPHDAAWLRSLLADDPVDETSVCGVEHETAQGQPPANASNSPIHER